MTQTAQSRGRQLVGSPDRSVRMGSIWVIKTLVLTLLVLNLLLMYGLFFSSGGLRAYRMQHGWVNDLTVTRVKLLQENQRMLHEIRCLKENPAVQERLVKRELGWVRPDEVIIEFVAPRNP